MEPWIMWVVAAAVVVLPLVLMVAFNGADEADSRGRRIDQRWRVTRERARGAKRNRSRQADTEVSQGRPTTP